MKAAEEIIFDVNKMAEGKNAFIFSSYYISPDNGKAAYFYNKTGFFAFNSSFVTPTPILN